MPFFATLGANASRAKGLLLGTPGYSFFERVITDVTNYNLRNNALASGWNGTTFLNATVIVNEGASIGSSSTATPAFDTGTLPTNSLVTLVNNGYIAGRGGTGGNGAGNSGSNGGLAINFNATGVVVNSGTIGGGGGGGGGGGNYTLSGSSLFGGSGGGGGAGIIAGSGGAGSLGSFGNGAAGSVASRDAGGSGGPSVSSSSPIVTLQAGTEFTASAVYQSSAGASSYWWSITIGGTVTSQGQGTTKAWVTGQKLFATNSSDSSVGRSNFVGEYAIIGDYTGSVQTYTVASGIPSAAGLSSPTTVFAELYGGGSYGGYTRINLPTTSQTYFYCVAPNGGETYTGFAGQTRFRWDRYGCPNSNQDSRGAGWTGLFNAHPYSGTTNYTTPASIIADSGIYGIAGGSGNIGMDAAGGGTTGGGGGAGGRQSRPGDNYMVQINNACTNSCSDVGTNAGVFWVCPSRLIGQWVTGGFETCTYGNGGGGYYPGGSYSYGPCAAGPSGGGSGYVGAIAGSGSFTQNGTGSNPTNSPYFVTQGRFVLRIR